MNTKQIAILMLCALPAACHDKQAPSSDNFTRALDAYLAERGELCVGKNEWPIDVTEREFELGTRDGKQMPVLERLGLVQLTAASALRKDEDQTFEVPVTRYELTPAGRAYFHPRSVTNAQGNRVANSDLCAVRLTLATLKSSQVSTDVKGQKSAVLWYTYHLDHPAPWASDPEFQRVFPAVAHVLAGAEKDELREEVTLTPAGWVANELLANPQPSVPAPSQASAR